MPNMNYADLPLAPETIDWRSYFQALAAEGAGLPTLEVLPAPCGDCAVTCHFYMEHALALREQAPDLQAEVLRTWFCHNRSDRACRGAHDVVLAQPTRTEE
jgi:hypothetical protein